RLTILSEAYSYLDFKGRVAVTESFVEEIFKYSALHADEIRALIKRVDEDAIRGRVAQQGVEFELKALDKPVDILVGEVEKVKNPRSGKMMSAMMENKFTPTPIPDYGLFAATKSPAATRAYIFRNAAGRKPAIAQRDDKGIEVEKLS